MTIPDSLAVFLRGHDPLAVAVSGGTDSTALLASCIDAGIDATAVFVETRLNPAGERERVSGLCRRLGADLVIVNCDMLGLPEVRGNSRSRCYACKHLMMSSVVAAAAEAGIMHAADGTNADDAAGAGRPGLLAVRELGVLSPFAECGIGRAAVESIAAALGTGVQPQSSCMATRFPEGTILDPAMIEMVRSGEAILRDAGIEGMLRLRCVDGHGVIECGSRWRDTAAGCTASLLELGFRSIAVSPDGYREGGAGSWRL